MVYCKELQTPIVERLFASRNVVTMAQQLVVVKGEVSVLEKGNKWPLFSTFFKRGVLCRNMLPYACHSIPW